ncbi:isoaspartyl peptidase/L-asparaginase family protein [Pedomonas mirosovicensis]|uniref:isoaspartyl peptidase/L-asparaginase family protein n=1 Tax=Pedomonas mirosovicensis TaxID=2908641 RepID=UPI00216845C0|nr:isoaspartyl peptidase/L-asparaginase [Pedomonas mirosovicensis]MCH8684556.1 isoaspartyl peptidase/L-asparaginase [Pedomonas mirosovicensis]
MTANIANAAPQGRYAIAVHGGAGRYDYNQFTDEQKAAYHAGLREALLTAKQVLEANGTAVDAVQAAAIKLENNPLFNAGKGAVLNSAGEVELDSSIMDGKTLAAGAVAGLKTTKSPITAARTVMEKSEHVMLQGAGADAFAKAQGLEQVPNSYFITPERKKQLENAQASKEKVNLSKFGTIGVVVLDRYGNLAAGTSTGGLTNKQWGRVGDSPIIGAGTYADNNSCAVSATGHGEYFIRATVARTICALVEFKGMPLQEAAEFVVKDKLVKMGGEGGVIAVDAHGNIALVMNTPGMFRGSLKEGEEPFTGILAGDK